MAEPGRRAASGAGTIPAKAKAGIPSGIGAGRDPKAAAPSGQRRGQSRDGKPLSSLDIGRLGDADPGRSVDRFLKLSGVVLALVCGLLPWAAYIQNSRTTQVAAASGNAIRDPLDRSHQHTIGLGAGTPGDDADLAALGVDPATTATTSAVGATGEQPKPEDASKQPFPAQPQFLLREVVGDMGMIEDRSGFWFVRKGSLLPDASHVAAISQSDGVWEITTDKGRVVRQTR
jgi:hypothetical protein